MFMNFCLLGTNSKFAPESGCLEDAFPIEIVPFGSVDIL